MDDTGGAGIRAPDAATGSAPSARRRNMFSLPARWRRDTPIVEPPVLSGSILVSERSILLRGSQGRKAARVGETQLLPTRSADK